MGLYEELRAALGLDDEEKAPLHNVELGHLMKGDELHHMSPEEVKLAEEEQAHPSDKSKLMTPRPPLDDRRWIGSWEPPEVAKAKLDAMQSDDPHNGVMVPAPPEKRAGFMNPEGKLQYASDRNAAESMADASITARNVPPKGVPAQRKSPEDLLAELKAAGAKDPEGTVDSVYPKEGPVEDPLSVLSRSGIKLEKPGQIPPPSDSRLQALLDQAKGRRGGRVPDFGGGRADVKPPSPQGAGPGELDLAKKGAPEAHAEAPTRAIGEQPTPNPSEASPPPMPPPEPGFEGSPVRSLAAKLAMGADPRTQALRDALRKSADMKALSRRITGMGIGADAAAGTHIHGEQGKGLSDAADDLVREAVAPTKFEQENQKFDDQQATSAQERQLKASAEGRAGSEEQRKQATFTTGQGKFDASSQTSKNARASIAALYPVAWNKIPQEVRDRFSAADVERVFGEVQQKDFAPKGVAGGGKQSAIDARKARDYAAKAKLNDPGMVQAMSDILATLDEGSAPGTGMFMNEGGWQNFLRSPDGQQFRQAMFTVMNPYIKEVHGANVTDNELERAMSQFGYGNFDDPQTLASGMRRVAEGMERKQKQRLSQLPPEAKKILEDQGAIEHVDSKNGRAIKGNPEKKFDDSFDLPPKVKQALGVLGLAKKWLGGGGGSRPARPQLDLESLP